MKTIVILGAGLSAAPIIRQTMVNTVLKRDDLKLVVVAPNTHFQWPIAMPRVIVPGQIPEDQVLVPLEPTFKDYPASKFTWVKGKASALDTTSNLVTVTLNNGSSQSVVYDTLIIATGSRARDGMPWKTLDTTEATKAKIRSLHSQIKKAKTIVVAGGGYTGVETAGELGFEYSRHGQKEVIFIHSSTFPLGPPLIDSVRKAARTELDKLKVKVIPNSTVAKATPSGEDTIIEVLSEDGTTKSITAQAYVPAFGITPNTEFMPSNLVDAQGFIKQTKHLRVEGHSNIFVVGDAGGLEASMAQTTEAQTIHLIKALPIYFNGGEVPAYPGQPKIVYGITVGRSRATGQMGTMKALSLMVWFFKGRNMGVPNVVGWAAGKKTMAKTFEK